MRKLFLFFCGALALPLLITSCQMKQQVDFIGYNGVVYTVDSTFANVQAFAVKDGCFVETGTTDAILSKYKVAVQNDTTYVDFKGAAVYPGLNDSHCHIYGLGRSLQNVNLRGTTSFEQILEKLQAAYRENPNRSFLVGDGWDQNLWPVKEFPTNEKLNELFPDIPVVLSRIDFHASIVNQAAIDKLELKVSDLGTKYNRAEAVVKNGKFTGVFLENMCDLFKGSTIMTYSAADVRNLILTAQQECFKYGLTSVGTEEGYDRLKVFDSLVNEGALKLKIDAWLSASADAFEHCKAPFANKNLKVTSLKLYSDGALGSRGATLLVPYSDDPKNSGIDVCTPEQFRSYCQWAYDRGFKVATHCIGDRANRQTLDIYGEFARKATESGTKLWWRIEHSQIVHPDDITKFKEYSVIPSVQPTHCTSDMFWADERLGERIKDAYRYKTLLAQNGWLPSGTDFPIEEVNPIYTFFAAVYRKNLAFEPAEGFQMEEALTKEEALRSMTIWGAKATGEEAVKGSIEAGKAADFIVTDRDFMTVPEREVPNTKVTATYLNGVNQLR